MKQKRFTEAQKAFALRQADSGVPVPEVLRNLVYSGGGTALLKRVLGGLYCLLLGLLRGVGATWALAILETEGGANMTSGFKLCTLFKYALTALLLSTCLHSPALADNKDRPCGIEVAARQDKGYVSGKIAVYRKRTWQEAGLEKVDWTRVTSDYTRLNKGSVLLRVAPGTYKITLIVGEKSFNLESFTINDSQVIRAMFDAPSKKWLPLTMVADGATGSRSPTDVASRHVSSSSVIVFLRDGRVIRGRFIGGNSSTVTIENASGDKRQIAVGSIKGLAFPRDAEAATQTSSRDTVDAGRGEKPSSATRDDVEKAVQDARDRGIIPKDNTLKEGFKWLLDPVLPKVKKGDKSN